VIEFSATMTTLSYTEGYIRSVHWLQQRHEGEAKQELERNDCAGLPNYLGPDGENLIWTTAKCMANCHQSSQCSDPIILW
jgi:hypothetical protein